MNSIIGMHHTPVSEGPSCNPLQRPHRSLNPKTNCCLFHEELMSNCCCTSVFLLFSQYPKKGTPWQRQCARLITQRTNADNTMGLSPCKVTKHPTRWPGGTYTDSMSPRTVEAPLAAITGDRTSARCRDTQP